MVRKTCGFCKPATLIFSAEVGFDSLHLGVGQKMLFRNFKDETHTKQNEKGKFVWK